MKLMKSIIDGKLWNNRLVIFSVAIGGLMFGIVVYFMISVDARDSSLESGWIWFLVATAMFIFLHRYVGRRGDKDRPEESISPDQSDHDDL